MDRIVKRLRERRFVEQAFRFGAAVEVVLVRVRRLLRGRLGRASRRIFDVG